jgi:hypothetical protein
MERRPTVGVGSRQPRLDAICDRGRTPAGRPRPRRKWIIGTGLGHLASYIYGPLIFRPGRLSPRPAANCNVVMVPPPGFIPTGSTNPETITLKRVIHDACSRVEFEAVASFVLKPYCLPSTYAAEARLLIRTENFSLYCRPVGWLPNDTSPRSKSVVEWRLALPWCDSCPSLM